MPHYQFKKAHNQLGKVSVNNSTHREDRISNVNMDPDTRKVEANVRTNKQTGARHLRVTAILKPQPHTKTPLCYCDPATTTTHWMILL